MCMFSKWKIVMPREQNRDLGLKVEKQKGGLKPANASGGGLL